MPHKISAIKDSVFTIFKFLLIRVSWYSLNMFSSFKMKSAPTEADALQNANSDRRQTIMMKHGKLLSSSMEFAVLPNSDEDSMSYTRKKARAPAKDFHDCLAYSVYHKMGGFVKLNFLRKNLAKIYIFQIQYIGITTVAKRSLARL